MTARTRKQAAVWCTALWLTSMIACGKKGPPRAPLRLVPDRVGDFGPRRIGDRVFLQFKVPAKNANGPGLVQLDRLEVYGITVAPGAVAPPNRDLMLKTHLIGRVDVKPPLQEDATEEELEKDRNDPRPGPGASAVFVEQLTPAQFEPAVLPKPAPAPAAPGAAATTTPVSAPAAPAAPGATPPSTAATTGTPA